MPRRRNFSVKRKTALERFIDKVAVVPGECWLWKGKRNEKGYGYFWTGLKQELAHRFAWHAWRGRIPKGKWVLHRCDNPPCVNPNHLFLGTPTDNMQDAKAKGRLVAPPVHTKLTDAQVAEIRACAEHPTALGLRYEVSREQIRRIKNGSSR